MNIDLLKKYYIKWCFIILFFLYEWSILYSQEPHSLISFPIVEMQLLNKQSVSVGLNLCNGNYGASTDATLMNEFNLCHRENDYVYCNKISASIMVFYLNLGLSINNYTNFNGYCLALAPEFGIGHPTLLPIPRLGITFPYIYYSYNIVLYRNNINLINTHNLSLRFWIPIKKKGEKFKYINEIYI